MRNREVKAEEKRIEKEYLIANTVAVIDENIETLKGVSASFEDKAYEAALRSRDDFANDLLESATEIDDLADDLEYVKLELETAAITAKAFGTISDKLPKAIAACKSALGGNYDFFQAW